MKNINQIGQKFINELTAANNSLRLAEKPAKEADKVYVTGVGATITKAYEQLRNASENSDEILLLQRAICRFYKRLLISPENFSKSGVDLISELTMAGYLKNDTIPKATAKKINEYANDFLVLRKALSKHINGDKLNSYTIDVLSVKIESLLNNHSRNLALSNLAYNYFIKAIDSKKLFNHKPTSYEAMILAATQKKILKYDDSIVRYNLISRYKISTNDPIAYEHFNKQIDKMFTDHDFEVLMRFIDRRSATFRVLSRQIENETLPKTLLNHDNFINSYSTAIQKTYNTVSKTVSKGVWRSIIFLIITKSIICIAMEVPYDIITAGAIMWAPLIINLLFPPLYMYLLRLTLIMPGEANTNELKKEIQRTLYSDEIDKIYLNPEKASASFNKVYQFAYSLIVIAVAAGAGYFLWTIGFNWVQLIVFFIFLSTASFLGFRLSRWIREIETVDSHQNTVTTLRDLIYMPFVVIGRWVSEKYSKMNIVSRILDWIVELPLKTILRWIRQWNNFMNAKKDEL